MVTYQQFQREKSTYEFGTETRENIKNAKKRLSNGEISIDEYDGILTRLKA
jgi:hypothetical protein